ncbi:hypothetical protein scyTo_0021262 [Scyliorhinus torazame]|uniref:Death domain-containing protein n=1 Tax=Scyliorhinus torazame TaxID=75743 RepID=A0A401Q0X8_SCYTO|nr:hypothetical protein [Scyliorhinus torazame]
MSASVKAAPCAIKISRYLFVAAPLPITLCVGAIRTSTRNVTFPTVRVSTVRSAPNAATDRSSKCVRTCPILNVEGVRRDITSMVASANPVQTPEEDKKIKNEDKTLPFEIPALDVKSDVIVEVLTQPLANSNIYGTSPQTTLLQHETRATSLEGKTLYEIINLVPVRRWKELMRVLQLRDCDIERIEMDVAQSRDQQYEMLRQWSQQCTASMESVYQALETMNLSGIVEELQIKLLNNANSLH